LRANTGTVLDRIVDARRASLERRKRLIPLNALSMTLRKTEPPRDFSAALARNGVNIIAELKKASPSRGVLREDFDPAVLAAELAASGAAALSVLTEEDFFQGSLENLRRARKAAALPVLRKDFLLDSWQVWESRAAEADSFLLIVAILQDELLRELLAAGRELGMEPLVEVHTREELRRALEAGAQIIGVNNRDLRTFDVRMDTSLELVAEIPEDCIAVSESGIRTAQDVARLRAAGFDAFLIGEHLMQSPDAGAALRALWTEHSEHRGS
jgi:indole-3-glycerol phosphate synthase